MSPVGPILSLVFIAVVATLLVKKYYPHAVLLLSGLVMLGVGYALGNDVLPIIKPTGNLGFDLFALVKESFSQTNAGVGPSGWKSSPQNAGRRTKSVLMYSL